MCHPQFLWYLCFWHWIRNSWPHPNPLDDVLFRRYQIDFRFQQQTPSPEEPMLMSRGAHTDLTLHLQFSISTLITFCPQLQSVCVLTSALVFPLCLSKEAESYTAETEAPPWRPSGTLDKNSVFLQSNINISWNVLALMTENDLHSYSRHCKESRIIFLTNA